MGFSDWRYYKLGFKDKLFILPFLEIGLWALSMCFSDWHSSPPNEKNAGTWKTIRPAATFQSSSPATAGGGERHRYEVHPYSHSSSSFWSLYSHNGSFLLQISFLCDGRNEEPIQVRCISRTYFASYIGAIW